MQYQISIHLIRFLNSYADNIEFPSLYDFKVFWSTGTLNRGKDEMIIRRPVPPEFRATGLTPQLWWGWRNCIDDGCCHGQLMHDMHNYGDVKRVSVDHGDPENIGDLMWKNIPLINKKVCRKEKNPEGKNYDAVNLRISSFHSGHHTDNNISTMLFIKRQFLYCFLPLICHANPINLYVCTIIDK
jgi:hypothetical protein